MKTFLYYAEHKWKNASNSTMHIYETFQKAWDAARDWLAAHPRQNKGREFIVVGSRIKAAIGYHYKPMKRWTYKTGWRNV